MPSLTKFKVTNCDLKQTRIDHIDAVKQQIFLIRGHRVMLDRDLAKPGQCLRCPRLRPDAGRTHRIRALSRRIDALEQKDDGKFKAVFDAFRELMMLPVKQGRQIGFVPADGRDSKEKKQ